ncbi:MAG: CsiV family protein [Halofilum sp. (in: g-proteobacteria)]
MRVHRTVLLCLLPLLATPALAETRYDVEIVLIERDSDRDAIEERWRPVIAVPEFERAGTFEGDAGNPLPEDFERLPAADTRLEATLDRLESSSRYRVLRHLHWRQPALEPGNSIPIRVRAGEPIAIEAPRDAIERPVPAADNESMDEKLEEGEEAVAGESGMENGALDSDPDPMLMRSPHAGGTQRVSVHPLDGTIELVVSRYLHIHADLYFTRGVDWDNTFMARSGIVAPAAETLEEESAAGEESAKESGEEAVDTGDDAMPALTDTMAPAIARGPDDEAMLSFPFSQSRRMRSGELHYLDHPLIGMLVLVTPYEEDQETEDGDG